MDNAPNMLMVRWNANLRRDSEDSPLIPPPFLAEYGSAVQIADVRSHDEATGVVGYIPGSAVLDPEQLDQLALDHELPLILICGDGNDSSVVARRLEGQGMSHVAALDGGIAAWRSAGLVTSRDPTGLRSAMDDRVAAAPESKTLSLTDVKRHAGDPMSIRWLKLPSMVMQGHVSCIDGRDGRGVVGSPGGDGGEFLLLLAAIEGVLDTELDEDAVQELLLYRLDTFGNFYMHTDLHAFDALIEALKADPVLHTSIEGVQTVEEWAEFLRAAKPEIRKALLKHLVDPAHIGCGHIRLMLQHSEEYGTRSELVLTFLRTFYRLWWAGSPEINLTALPDDHNECAIVNVRLADKVWGMSQIPLISPSYAGRQMFINHPEVSEFLRIRTAQAFARGLDWLKLDSAGEDALHAAVDDLAAQQLGVTVGYLAKGLPIFDIVFDRDGTIVEK